jgi:hypothetical protein
VFERASVVGVLVDMDRGFINFFKDGNDLGWAFKNEGIKLKKLYPFVQTRVQCKFHLFHPTTHPIYSVKK